MFERGIDKNHGDEVSCSWRWYCEKCNVSECVTLYKKPPNPITEMALRDWYAGQALAGFCAISGEIDAGYDELAAQAYKHADAMLAAREAAK